MYRRFIFLSTALVATLLAYSSGLTQSARANYLVNGSFETGDISGWTPSSNYDANNFVESGLATDGTNALQAGQVGDPAYLSQTFSDTFGQTLHVSGSLLATGDSPSSFSMYFFTGLPPFVDGPNPLALPLVSLTDPDTTGWLQFNFDVTATGFDTFMVGFQDDPGFLFLDNFSVEPSAAAVPGPITGTGVPGVLFVAVGLLAWRLRRNSGSTLVPA
jgi:hypothetical protein